MNSALFKAVALLMVPLSCLAGCGVLDFADDEYGCTGLPRGVSCRSARDVLLHSGNPASAEDTGTDAGKASLAGSSDPVPEAPGVLKLYYSPFTDSRGDWHPETYLLIKTGGGQWLQPGGERK